MPSLEPRPSTRPRLLMRLPLVVVAVLVLTGGPGVRGQGATLGTFRWQLLPFCNVVSLTVVQQGGQYHVDGTDDLCNAPRQASVVGRAFPNPDGSIGLGLTTVTTIGAAPVHIDARIALDTLSGPWTDSAGNGGTFTFRPGPATGGGPRPVPPGGIAPGSITSAHLAPGAVTAAQLAPGAITTAGIAAAAAGFGACPAGAYLRGLQPDGTVLCEPIGTPPTSTAVDTGSILNASLAIGQDGLAIISAWDLTNGDLRITRCLNSACTAAASRTVDATNSVGQFSDIAIGTDGLPIISHFDETNGDLRVTHCSDAACTAATSTNVDTAVGLVTGKHTSIAIGTDGLAIVSHYDETNRKLRISHCSNAACTAATHATISSANDIGQYTSIAIGADGMPVVSHRDVTSGDLRVTHCGNLTCTSATTVRIDTPQVVGIGTSLAIGRDGVPIVSTLDASTNTLRVTYCGTVTCSSARWTNLDTADYSGMGSSIVIGSDGLPVISHYHGSTRAFRVSRCADVTCTSATSTTIGMATNIPGPTSLALAPDGLPIVAYTNFFGTATDLRVVKCQSRTCR